MIICNYSIDYYNMKNIIADTGMKEDIGKGIVQYAESKKDTGNND